MDLEDACAAEGRLTCRGTAEGPRDPPGCGPAMGLGELTEGERALEDSAGEVWCKPQQGEDRRA